MSAKIPLLVLIHLHSEDLERLPGWVPSGRESLLLDYLGACGTLNRDSGWCWASQAVEVPNLAVR